ncbi:MAG: glycosyltransferase [Acetobacterium woodii]|nr:glycosyltransferase [Acetobacterium woodii]
MEKIKVLLLLYSLEPGGAEKVVLSIAKHIDRNRFSPVVCAFKNGRLHPDFAKLKIPIYVLNKKSGIDISLFWKLRRVLKTENIKIIHSHNFSPNFWGRFIGYIVGIPILITTEHTLATSKTRLQKTIDHILSKITTKIIAVSNSVCDSHIREEDILPEKFVTIYNGIEPWNDHEEEINKFRSQFLKEFGIVDDSCIITTIGRLEPPKGYENLLKAIPLIHRIIPEPLFLIVGDGYLKTKIETLTRNLGIRERVVFTGFRSDIRKILGISNLCVIPSLREGFSITLLEAMSTGKPVVATDVGGNSEAISNGETGIIVPPDDPAALANGIIAVLNDKHMAEKMGLKARERFERLFTIQKMIDETEKLFESVKSNLN